MKSKLPFVCHGCRSDRKVALTFDDGPNPCATHLFLDILKDYNCVATFFLIGRWAVEFPRLVTRILDEGHLIGGHTFSHAAGRNQFADTLYDFNRGNAIIKDITQEVVRFIRVPTFEYCARNNDGRLKIHELVSGNVSKKLFKREIVVVDCDVDSGDWYATSEAEISNRVLLNAKNGSIILFHDGSELRLEHSARFKQSVKALPNVIQTLKRDGFEFVKLDDLKLVYDYKTIE